MTWPEPKPCKRKYGRVPFEKFNAGFSPFIEHHVNFGIGGKRRSFAYI